MSLEREAWLARRLGDFGAVFAGVTDPATRKARIREAIVTRGLEAAIAGRGSSGKPETFREVFERLFREAL